MCKWCGGPSTNYPTIRKRKDGNAVITMGTEISFINQHDFFKYSQSNKYYDQLYSGMKINYQCMY